jgi:hypothetical protein
MVVRHLPALERFDVVNLYHNLTLNDYRRPLEDLSLLFTYDGDLQLRY